MSNPPIRETLHRLEEAFGRGLRKHGDETHRCCLLGSHAEIVKQGGSIESQAKSIFYTLSQKIDNSFIGGLEHAQSVRLGHSRFEVVADDDRRLLRLPFLNFVAADEFLGDGGGVAGFGLVIFDHDDEGAAEDAAAGVDFGDGHLDAAVGLLACISVC